MSEPLLEVRGLCSGYGDSRVLDGISFSMGVEAVGIIGRNGMGKTTLCDTLMGLVPTTSGEVLLHGEHIEGRATRHLLRPTGPPPVRLADGRRAPGHAGQGDTRQTLDP